MSEHAAPSSKASPSRSKIGNHPEQDALSGAGLAADRDAFAGPKREINRPDMKSAQHTAFEDGFTCRHAFSFPSRRKPRPDRPAGIAAVGQTLCQTAYA